MKHLVAWWALGMGFAFNAHAEDVKVAVTAEVVWASTQGQQVDPPSLSSMKEKLSKKASYTSLRRLSLQKLTLPVELKLPNQQVATLKLEELKNGVAKVQVSVPPLSTLYTLGREGSLYQAAGKYENGDLWLVLSPAR